MIETVATPKLATQLNKAWAWRAPGGGSLSGGEEAASGASEEAPAAAAAAADFHAILNVLVQVNTSGEECTSFRNVV
jgi:hypothetical protein